MHRFNFRNYQPMNIIAKSNQGYDLWLGDYGAATDFNLLNQKKVKHVLTAAAMLNIFYPKDLDINHKVLNAFDMPSYKMTPHFQEAFQFINEGLKTGNVLVHCAAGISRSTTCVIVYLMRTRGTTFKQSLDLCRSKRPIVNPNYGFQNQLQKYDKLLKKKSVNSKEKELIGKLPKDALKVDLMKREAEEEKNAVMNFIDQERSKPRFNSTVGGKGAKKYEIGQYDNKAMMGVRGKSTMYRSTINERKNIEGSNKIAQQFLTFKLEKPRIVTIKR